MGGRGSTSGKAEKARGGSGNAEQKIKSVPTETKSAKQSTTQEMKTQATQQPKSTTQEMKTQATQQPKSTTQEMKTQATQQPKSTTPKQNAADIALRKKNANAFDSVTSAKLNTMTLSQLRRLARKAYLYDVGKHPWDPQSEEDALSRFDSLADYQSKSALKKIIMSGKKEAKNFK